MERKGKFRRGPAHEFIIPGVEFNVFASSAMPGTCSRVANFEMDNTDITPEEMSANAHLIASAFNSATACEDMGYDGVECVKALPELVKLCESVVKMHDGLFEQCLSNGMKTAWGADVNCMDINNAYDEALTLLAKCRG